MNTKEWFLSLVFCLLFVVVLSPSVHAICTMTTTPVLFGAYNVLSPAPLDTTGILVYRCGNRDHNIMISFDPGGAPSFAARRMLNGSQQLFYNLYLNAARTVIWGDGTGGTGVYFIHNPQPSNQDISVPIFGRIPAGQNVGSGTYDNTITVTLNY